MTFSEALEHLKAGKRVRSKYQDKDKFYMMDKTGHIREYVMSVNLAADFLFLEALNILTDNWDILEI